MRKYSISTQNFTESYKKIADNSLQFEVMCSKESFNIGSDTSRLGIFYWDNELLTTYLPSIIENSTLLDISTSEMVRKYNMNPHRLSKDLTGVTDYWYIILALNNYSSIFEFKNFKDKLLIPDVKYLDSLITTIERNR